MNPPDPMTFVEVLRRSDEEAFAQMVRMHWSPKAKEILLDLFNDRLTAAAHALDALRKTVG